MKVSPYNVRSLKDKADKSNNLVELYLVDSSSFVTYQTNSVALVSGIFVPMNMNNLFDNECNNIKGLEVVNEEYFERAPVLFHMKEIQVLLVLFGDEDVRLQWRISQTTTEIAPDICSTLRSGENTNKVTDILNTIIPAKLRIGPHH